MDDKLKRAIDRRMAGAALPAASKARILQAAAQRKGRSPMKMKRLLFTAAAVLAAMLAMACAYVGADWFGMVFAGGRANVSGISEPVTAVMEDENYRVTVEDVIYDGQAVYVSYLVQAKTPELIELFEQEKQVKKEALEKIGKGTLKPGERIISSLDYMSFYINNCSGNGNGSVAPSDGLETGEYRYIDRGTYIEDGDQSLSITFQVLFPKEELEAPPIPDALLQCEVPLPEPVEFKSAEPNTPPGSEKKLYIQSIKLSSLGLYLTVYDREFDPDLPEKITVDLEDGSTHPLTEWTNGNYGGSESQKLSEYNLRKCEYSFLLENGPLPIEQVCAIEIQGQKYELK